VCAAIVTQLVTQLLIATGLYAVLQALRSPASENGGVRIPV
jgi:hypothetical protein